MSNIETAARSFANDMAGLLKQKILREVSDALETFEGQLKKKYTKDPISLPIPPTRERSVPIDETRDGKWTATLPDGKTITQKRRRDVVRAVRQHGF